MGFFTSNLFSMLFHRPGASHAKSSNSSASCFQAPAEKWNHSYSWKPHKLWYNLNKPEKNMVYISYIQ